MKRRSFLLGTATGLTAAASGYLVLTNAFTQPAPTPKPALRILPAELQAGDPWIYHKLDLDSTAEIAYNIYSEGSCMYASFGSIITQLAKQYGEPYASFPHYMMKYGATGIGGYGSVCGSLNGAAAIIGLFVKEKSHMNALIEECFAWYEKTMLPIYLPKETKYSIPSTVSNSVLCHASTAKWALESGSRLDSKERTERCSRLTADVAKKTVGLLNDYFDGQYESSHHLNTDTSTCVQCHSEQGKLANIKGKMECASCHETSWAHHIFADVHYEFMD